MLRFDDAAKLKVPVARIFCPASKAQAIQNVRAIVKAVTNSIVSHFGRKCRRFPGEATGINKDEMDILMAS